MNWSFQLYSARKSQPWSGILKMLADAGYAQVEGFGGLYDNPAALRAELDGNGLAMPTGHFSLDMLEGDFGTARRIAGTLGIGTVICPHIAADARPSDEAGWRAFAHRLAAVHDECRKAGLRFAWHNHDFEFLPQADGSIPQRVILDSAPEIGWEMDVAWVVRGGGDPMAWIEEYPSRIVAAHVKDIAPAGAARDEDGWADVGHGTLDWPGLLKALRDRTPAKVFVMEHDNPSDVERFARRSIEAVKAFGE
ncbi:sugar phosphate isomerase/epimerase [Aquamicrobium sp. LC103]|uniref:sugar phosphate isomerase/epimerase family protein n=1 Tax=Aquamicrobium sp. LC103 TaxID=1120658 RepID=UPI00063E7276|nr:sugar phosphate isomerase/epimerase [Aquamicrobium sp. LC103]TKT82736.1 sugar phosphate isomerase/epimerase [Aquamicrobium sp. LC103]